MSFACDPLTPPTRSTLSESAEHHASFPDAAPDALVVAQVAHLEPKYSRLNPRPDRSGQRIEPLSKRTRAIRRQVLANGQGHPRLSANVSYVIIIIAR